MPYTNADWAATVLADAGLPQTQQNVNNMMSWMTAEEPTNNWFDRNNPLNASLGTSASDGTGSYPDLNTGAAFTAAMIKQSNMSGIYNALKNNDNISAFSSAVVASPWAGGHYGGNPNHIAQIPTPSIVNAPTNQAPGQVNVTGAAGNFNPNSSVVSLPVVGTLVNAQQANKIKGWSLMIGGAVVAFTGLGVIVAAMGLESKAAQAIGSKNPAVGAAVSVASSAKKASGSKKAGPRQEPDTTSRGERRHQEREAAASDREAPRRRAELGAMRGPRGAERPPPPRGSRHAGERTIQPRRRDRGEETARREAPELFQ